MRLVLSTPRLLLRELETDDLEVTAALLGDRRVMRYWPRPYTRAGAADWIARQRERYARDGHGYWLLLERATGRAIGQAGLLEREVDGVSELALGCIIERAQWRRGVAFEAATTCLAHARDVLHRRTIALIRPKNRPSIALALKLGMRPGRTTIFARRPHVVYELPGDAAPAAP